MGVGAEGSQRQAADEGLKGEGINVDGIENILAAEGGREEVVDLGDEGVAAEFERVALAVAADGFGEVLAVLIGFARQDGGAAESVEHAGDFRQGLIGITLGPLIVARNLGAEMAYEFRGDRKS